mgnify:CR=1 FL=1
MAAVCPICRRNPPADRYKPFCSKHCADVDLQRWFSGGYAIPDSVDDPSDAPDEEA